MSRLRGSDQMRPGDVVEVVDDRPLKGARKRKFPWRKGDRLTVVRLSPAGGSLEVKGTLGFWSADRFAKAAANG